MTIPTETADEDLLHDEDRRLGAAVIPNPNRHFQALRNSFPARLGGIDWNGASLIASSSAPTGETGDARLVRLRDHYRTFLSLLDQGEKDELVLLSDDYFESGVAADADTAASILARWVELPHAVFITTPKADVCLHVAFCGSMYVGRSRST